MFRKMPSAFSRWLFAETPAPPEGRPWEPLKSHCANGFAGGPAVAGCSGSAVIVTGTTNSATNDADGKCAGNNCGPPTGNTLKVRRVSIPSLRVYSGGAGTGACSAMMALACVVRSSFSLGVKRLSPLTHLLIR